MSIEYATINKKTKLKIIMNNGPINSRFTKTKSKAKRKNRKPAIPPMVSLTEKPPSKIRARGRKIPMYITSTQFIKDPNIP